MRSTAGLGALLLCLGCGDARPIGGDASIPFDGSRGLADASMAMDAARPIDGSHPADGGVALDAPLARDAGPPPVATCVTACSTAGDCATGSSPAYDADNYECRSGGCFYTGCNSDSECTTSLARPGVCRDAGAGVRVCLLACTSVSDCANPSSPAYDEDNYECRSGACIYTGCNSDAECAATLPYPAVCRYVGTVVPGCVAPCTSASDCAIPTSPAYDADNYECLTNACVYTGCNTDEECTASIASPAVCR